MVRPLGFPDTAGIADARDFATFRKYLADLRAEVERETARGKTGDSLVQAILPTLKANYGTWGFFSDYAADDIQQIARELAGTKRLPPNAGP